MYVLCDGELFDQRLSICYLQVLCTINLDCGFDVGSALCLAMLSLIATAFPDICILLYLQADQTKKKCSEFKEWQKM